MKEIIDFMGYVLEKVSYTISEIKLPISILPSGFINKQDDNEKELFLSTLLISSSILDFYNFKDKSEVTKLFKTISLILEILLESGFKGIVLTEEEISSVFLNIKEEDGLLSTNSIIKEFERQKIKYLNKQIN